MKLKNDTRYPARLFRGCIDERRIVASTMVRVTYDLEGGVLRPAEQQLWPVSPGPWDGPHGPMPSDQRFVRDGVDVLVFGSARSAGGRQVPYIEVEVRVGPAWRARIHAWGDRVWRGGRGGLVASAPEPVREVPLTLARAFGGKDRWDGIDVPFVDNPEGRGYYLDEASARGGPLPDLEDPDAFVRAWTDHPEPVGTGACAMHFGPRVRRGFELDDDSAAIRKIRPIYFNDAFPRMIAPRAQPGDRVELRGVREDGVLAFTLPDSGLRVRVQIGDDAGERIPTIDQIGVEPDARRVFITYRFPFRYRYTPHQRRCCTLGLAPSSRGAALCSP